MRSTTGEEGAAAERSRDAGATEGGLGVWPEAAVEGVEGSAAVVAGKVRAEAARAEGEGFDDCGVVVKAGGREEGEVGEESWRRRFGGTLSALRASCVGVNTADADCGDEVPGSAV